jgi:phosphoglycerate kinase
MDIKSISDAKVQGKKVFVRLDFDVPIKNGDIEDDSRLISGFETVKYLLEKEATVLAAGHIGRPDGVDVKLSTEIVAKWFKKKLLTSRIQEVEIEGLKAFKLNKNLFVLENLRFDKGEEENSAEFSQKLASTAQIYVNEAFGVSHRKHASVYGVAKLLPSFAGYHLMREVKILSKALKNPKRPLTFIIGGAKIETKLPLISKMHRFADFVLVGGELAEQTKILAKEQHAQIKGQKAMLLVADLLQNTFDITLNSVKNFEQVIEKSETIVWNGPMGFIEEGYGEATLELAKIIDKKKAYKIIGGGDTIGFLSDKKLLNNYDLVSMGGGAMLEFLSGDKLPGIEALES